MKINIWELSQILKVNGLLAGGGGKNSCYATSR